MKMLRIGIAGLGTVGSGTLKILREHAAMLEYRCDKPIVVSAVSARNKSKHKASLTGQIRWCDDPLSMAARLWETTHASDPIALDAADAEAPATTLGTPNGRHVDVGSVENDETKPIVRPEGG